MFPNEEILEGVVPIQVWQLIRDKSFFAIDHEKVTVLLLAKWVAMEGAFIIGDDEG